MFGFIGKIILRSRLKRNEADRYRNFISWEKVETVAIVISSRDKVAKNMVDNFVKDSRKFIEVFYVELNKKTPSYNDWQCFIGKHRSFFNLPKKVISKELEKKQFDVVINTASESDVFSRSLCEIIQAPFKCSTGNLAGVDLVIERPDGYKLLNYLEEVIRYLKMIRIK
jgi:hypothetical protein